MQSSDAAIKRYGRFADDIFASIFLPNRLGGNSVGKRNKKAKQWRQQNQNPFRNPEFVVIRAIRVDPVCFIREIREIRGQIFVLVTVSLSSPHQHLQQAALNHRGPPRPDFNRLFRSRDQPACKPLRPPISNNLPACASHSRPLDRGQD